MKKLELEYQRLALLEGLLPAFGDSSEWTSMSPMTVVSGQESKKFRRSLAAQRHRIKKASDHYCPSYQVNSGATLIGVPH